MLFATEPDTIVLEYSEDKKNGKNFLCTNRCRNLMKKRLNTTIARCTTDRPNGVKRCQNTSERNFSIWREHIILDFPFFAFYWKSNLFLTISFFGTIYKVISRKHLDTKFNITRFLRLQIRTICDHEQISGKTEKRSFHLMMQVPTRWKEGVDKTSWKNTREIANSVLWRKSPVINVLM